MLTSHDNETLTGVGKSTAGGALLRHYWIPCLLSEELPGPDCTPLRLRLLGEDLIAFRATSGTIGIVEDHCPHRGASLFFGRNEEEGLRCVYHGWKFDTAGVCVDMPSEPTESNFKSKVRVAAYPSVERHGVIWVYMGPASPPPALPELEWNEVPESHRYISKRVQSCNWFQALEGGIDPVHSNFIHSLFNQDVNLAESSGADRQSIAAMYKAKATHLHFETIPMENGVLVANRRNAGEGNYYWRSNHYLMPFYTLFPPALTTNDSLFSGFAWVPIDDTSTLAFHWTYRATSPLAQEEIDGMRFQRNGLDAFHLSEESRAPKTTRPHGAWYPVQSGANDYMIDYDAQRTLRFSGIPGGWNQDAAVQETMGPVSDRRREHLGTSDLGIIAARRYFLAAANSVASGASAPGIENPQAWSKRPVSLFVPEDQDWLELTKQQLSPPRGIALAAQQRV
jgi:phenylpropionate dioxygenase-like ring-hydroxylating dioxygenase large terminal subunit